MPKGIRILHISVGERNLTHFGGIFLVHQFCKKLRLKWHLQKGSSMFQSLSSSRIDPGYHLCFDCWYSSVEQDQDSSRQWCFSKNHWSEEFSICQQSKTLLKTGQSQTIQGINKVHDHLRLKMFYLPKPRTSLLFDLDSVVFTIYGKQIEGAKVGYNPHKKGARSYHPLLCFESHSKDFWHGILRPGDASSSTGSVEFWEECLNKLPPYVYRIRLRAASGFFNHKFIEVLEDKNNVIVAKMTNPIKNRVAGLRYHRFKKGWGAAEFQYTPYRWKKSYRFIAIRRPLKDVDSDQLTLFTIECYAYQVFVTNLSLKPQNIWYFYKGRAIIEKNIRELEESFALAKVPTNSFLANQAYFYLLLFAYNIVH